MSKIELRKINKFYGANHVLRDVDLTIGDGEFMTLLGPSGCGKTTTLRVVAGLERPQSGTITMDDKVIVNADEQFFAPPSKRGLNLVFQSYALWPHMTVFENVAFGLQVQKTPKPEIKRLVESALSRMQIAEFAKRYPSELSGGQQQRVAIARAIASSPKLLLLDEPLSNLDAKLRIDMRGELKRLHQELGATVIYVTHDQVEALTLSTRIAVFFEGSIEQVDTPMEIYRNPASLRVANFIGNPRINIISGRATAENGRLRVSSVLGEQVFTGDELTASNLPNGAFDCKIGFRPEQIEIAPGGSIKAKVYACMPAGSETLLQLVLGGEQFLCKLLGIRHFHTNDEIALSVSPECFNVFGGDDGKLLKRCTVE